MTLKSLHICVVCLALLASCAGVTEQQDDQTSDRSLPHIGDEFAELDAVSSDPYANDFYVSVTIESARMKYYSALEAYDQGDTLRSARYFEQALNTMNTIADLPQIDQNVEFSDLMQNIFDDFSAKIQSIEYLDENSSAYALRDRFFREADDLEGGDGEEIVVETLEIPDSELVSEIAGYDEVFGFDELSIPLVDNKYVGHALEFMNTEKGKKFFRKWLERAGRWFPMMRQIAREEGVPEEIVFLSMIESALKPDAVSKARAVGMWQFMKPTAGDFDLKVDYWVDERKDPEKSTRAAMRFLTYLYSEFGDWHLALAAYNCGGGGVRRAIRRAGKSNPTFWNIRHALPRETRSYVPLYVATARIALNAEKYGHTGIEFEPRYDYAEFEVSESVDLSALAKLAGLENEELEALNPELIRSTTPPDVETYKVKVPVRSLAAIEKGFPTLTDDEKRAWVLHEVQPSDNLRSISRNYGVSEQVLIEANDLRRNRLYAGTLLRIPNPSLSAELEARLEEQLAEQRAREAEDAKAVGAEGLRRVRHKIRRGETLNAIARRYGVTTAELRKWNSMSASSSNIRAGSMMDVWVKDAGIGSEVNVEPSIVQHKVRRGETVGKIAQRYGVRISDIRRYNSLNSRNVIRVGQVLSIPVGASGIASQSAPSSSRSEKLVHTIRRGETLGQIAEAYSVSVRNLQQWNPGTVRGTRITAGDKLNVYVRNAAVGGGAGSSAPEYYKIRRGDTFATVASRYGMSVKALKRLNPNVNPRRLQIGQRIRLR